jgi:hypothetical protein
MMRLESLTGDGAYDTQPAYEAVEAWSSIPSFLHARMLESARAVSLHRNALPHADGWAKYLETLEWLPPAKLGGNQDELHQTTGRA